MKEEYLCQRKQSGSVCWQSVLRFLLFSPCAFRYRCSKTTTFAEVGYDGAGKGFMDIIFGPLFGRGFEMEVVEKDEFCEIIDGKETWVS